MFMDTNKGACVKASSELHNALARYTSTEASTIVKKRDRTAEVEAWSKFHRCVSGEIDDHKLGGEVKILMFELGKEGNVPDLWGMSALSEKLVQKSEGATEDEDKRDWRKQREHQDKGGVLHIQHGRQGKHEEDLKKCTRPFKVDHFVCVFRFSYVCMKIVFSCLRQYFVVFCVSVCVNFVF